MFRQAPVGTLRPQPKGRVSLRKISSLSSCRRRTPRHRREQRRKNSKVLETNAASAYNNILYIPNKEPAHKMKIVYVSLLSLAIIGQGAYFYYDFQGKKEQMLLTANMIGQVS